MRSTSTERRGIAAGFTLIELMAVVAMIALVAGLALPNFGLRSRRAMEDEARQLAADLEFARQRSVLTGIPHRLVIDAEGGTYRLEWLVSEARALGEEEPEVGFVYEMGDLEQVPMAPPAAAQLRYHALPGYLGRTSVVRDGIRIDGVETADGFFEQGPVSIVFERNGTSESSRILLSDDDGDAIGIEVAPFADTVRIRHEAL